MTPPRRDAADIRAKLDHPVLDVDGHVIEFMPAVMPYLREALGPAAVRPLRQPAVADRQDPRRRHGDPPRSRAPRSRRGGAPRRRTPATSPPRRSPGCMYERIDELGIDYSVLYPTKGFGIAGIDDDELRAGVCRGFNEFYADDVRPVRRPDDGRRRRARCTPPTRPSPSSSTASRLGLKVVGFPEGVTRPIPEPEPTTRSPFLVPGPDATGSTPSASTAPTTTTRCGPSPRSSGSPSPFHGGLGNMPPGRFTSVTNYTLQPRRLVRPAHALAVQVAVHGRRAPPASPASTSPFLECGVGWATILLCDLLEHWEKRNPRACEPLDPAGDRLGRARGATSPATAPTCSRRRRHRPRRGMRALPGTGMPPERPRTSGASSTSRVRAELVDRFVDNFYFGCEADDRTIAFAFSPANPRRRAQADLQLRHRALGCRRSPGWWTRPTSSSRTACYRGRQFRRFVFEHPARSVPQVDPHFFDGTPVAQYLRTTRTAAAG